MERTALQIPEDELKIAEIYAKKIPYSLKLLEYIDREQLEVEARVGLELAKKAYKGGPKFHIFAYRVIHNRCGEEVRRQSHWTRGQRALRKKNLNEGKEPEPWMLPALSVEDLSNGYHENLKDDCVSFLPLFPSEDEGFEERETRKQIIATLLSVLDNREKSILYQYFYLDRASPKIISISEETGKQISISRVQQILKRALKKMRKEAERIGFNG